MVIMVGIGVYLEMDIEEMEIDEKLKNLDAIRVDIANVIKLFESILHYEIYPDVYQNKDADNYKVQWSELELKELLKEKARTLQHNLKSNEIGSDERYDALLVVLVKLQKD